MWGQTYLTPFEYIVNCITWLNQDIKNELCSWCTSRNVWNALLYVSSKLVFRRREKRSGRSFVEQIPFHLDGWEIMQFLSEHVDYSKAVINVFANFRVGNGWAGATNFKDIKKRIHGRSLGRFRYGRWRTGRIESTSWWIVPERNRGMRT